MSAMRKRRKGAPTNPGRQDTSEPDLEGLLEQRRRVVPQVPGWQEFIDAALEETDVTLGDG